MTEIFNRGYFFNEGVRIHVTKWPFGLSQILKLYDSVTMNL